MFVATATATTATFLAKARVFYYDYDSCYHEGLCDYHSQCFFLMLSVHSGAEASPDDN